MFVSEFRIFKKGKNETSKGTFLFDTKSAELVMSDYKRSGVDVMIDLEHLSLDTKEQNFDPDARGWCKLEVRNGDLWATNVKWTDDGLKRLKERRQRYVSPAFSVNKDTLRIESLYNIAICAIPATYQAPALVAASARIGKQLETLSIEVKAMEELKKVALKLGLDEGATLEEVLAAIATLQEDQSAADDPPKEDETATDDDGDSDGDKEDKETKALSKLPPAIRAKVYAALHGNKELQKRLAGVEATQRTSEVERLIADNTDKIPQDAEAWARKQDPAVLREYLKHLPPAVKQVATEKKREGAAEVTLTDEDRAVAKLTGTSPEKVLEFKKKKLAEKQSA